MDKLVAFLESAEGAALIKLAATALAVVSTLVTKLADSHPELLVDLLKHTIPAGLGMNPKGTP